MTKLNLKLKNKNGKTCCLAFIFSFAGSFIDILYIYSNRQSGVFYQKDPKQVFNKIMRKIFLILCAACFFAETSFAENNLSQPTNGNLNLQMFNTFSNLHGKAFGSKTEKQVLNNFIEYPLSKKMSIGSINQISHVDSNHNGDTSAYAINSVELFNRYKFFSRDKFGITMHNAYKFPGIYNENSHLALMPKQADYELRFLFAYNMPDRLVNTITRNETPYFGRAEIAYRRRFSNPFDEMRFAFWAGIKLNQTFSLLLQDNITWNVNAKATLHDNSYSNLSNFQTSKNANNTTTTSLMYHIDKDAALQFGYVYRVSGNAPFYDKHGVLIGLWNSF